ncbi:NUDIX hydrolase [bacterium]|nr:NUDIX hydrolase [bacterium]
MNVLGIDETLVAISASNIRNMIADNNNLESVMSKSAIEYLEEIFASKRLNNLIPKPRNPYLATDTIIEYNNQIILVKRKKDPKKYVLPGGFVEYEESAENAVIREAKEETNINFKINGLLGFYSDPNRDPRKHIATAVFYGKGEGNPKKNEESEALILSSVENAAFHMDLAFDHNKILKDYIQKKKN